MKILPRRLLGGEGLGKQSHHGSSNRREHVLVACPPVFSYHHSILSELEALGFESTWWNDRGSESSAYKIGLRLLPDLVATLSTPTFERRLRRLEGLNITRILVVKGEGMSIRFIQMLRAAFPRARLSLYFWDSIENAPRARRIAPLFDQVATFDPVDAKKLGWIYRPLFARAITTAVRSQEPMQYDWCFIGTLHSDRFRVVVRLKCAHPELRSFFFGYVPSRLLLALRYLKDRGLFKVPRRFVSTRMMPPEEVAAIAHVSRAMLDVEHPRQRGLTMRTIEALLSGRKLLTTNRHVLETDLFDPSRVQVISRTAPRVSEGFLDVETEPIDPEVSARYTLDRWLIDLIGAPPSPERCDELAMGR